MTVLIPPALVCDPHAKARFPHLVNAVRQAGHPFYVKRLAGDPVAVPLLKRDDILKDNHGLLNGHPVTAKTSGSTGTPVKIAWSPQRKALEQAAHQKILEWVGATKKPTLIVLVDADDLRASDKFVDIRLPLSEQIEALKRRHAVAGADGLTTFPTNAEFLSRAILEAGHDMSFIKVVGLYAEVFEPHQEVLIRKAFPAAKIWSVYSSMELGMIAARCPHDPNYYHLLNQKLGIEILNDRDEPAGKGELGRLVITDYFNDWSPLIRYDIGDLAAFGTCSCGRKDLPAITRLAGKVRGALLHRDGRRIPFASLSVAIRDLPDVKQYQVIQHELDHFELRIVRNEELTDEAFEKLVLSCFEKEFGYLPDLKVTPETEIERHANGKFYASISHV